MSLYCTLADVRSELNADSTVDDQKVMRGVRQLSRRIDTMFRNQNLFVPVIQTRRIALSNININSWERTLILRSPQQGVAPLLLLTGVTINSTALVIGTSVQAYPQPYAPYYQLQLIGDCALSWYDYCNVTLPGPRFASVAGVWGYNMDYANAWLAVDDLSAGINASVTTLTVADVDGDNPYGEAPRISAGNVIQIDTEWMDVIATNITTNTVTVVRGVNGSTAAAHLVDAPVSVYLVDESIRRICRQAAFQYSRIGAFDTSRISDFSTLQFPEDFLQEVKDLLNLFANL
jgi:hypothetical protein